MMAADAGQTNGRGASSSLSRLRADVVDCCRSLARSGLVVGTAGNVSARAGDLVVITPTGSRLSTVTAGELAVVDLGGRLVSGSLEPTSELPLHLGVYNSYDARAVVHTHPPMGTAVACVVDELPCIHYALLALGPTVRVARYATFGTNDLAASVVEALEGRSACLMASHGAVTYGRDLQAAMDATELLEWGCGVYVNACACGTPRVLDAGLQREVVAALSTYGTTSTQPKR
jgi:L-fuculose-phosphate aldolase